MSQIELLAGELLRGAKVVKPPVPLKRLARSLGATIRYEPYPEDDEDLSGILIRQKGKTIIGVNALHPHVRRRFTIAHEIGHMMLHKGDDLFVDGSFKRNRRSSQAIDQKEIAANQFAAALLMPHNFIEKELRSERLVFLSRVHQMAKRFDVSADAMSFRLTNLGYAINQAA